MHELEGMTMTIADFLAQATFWQWVGLILIANALARFRFFHVTRTCSHKEGE
jgi:hypothetical protein